MRTEHREHGACHVPFLSPCGTENISREAIPQVGIGEHTDETANTGIMPTMYGLGYDMLTGSHRVLAMRDV